MARGTIIAGRTCVVTGAGSGIGRALALRLSRHGCPVAICDWDEDGLAETAGQITGPVLQRKLDVRDRQGQMTWAAEVSDWAPAPFGMIINNAGVTVSQSAAEAASEDDEWVIDVNFWGVVHGTRAFLPLLLAQDSGAIVNVSSVFGIVGWPTQSAYCASKAAVRGYTESLRHELRDGGVRAVAVHPGGVATHIVDNARFHVDDRGNTDKSVLQRDFKKVARTSPDRAAAIIHRGVERGKGRILVGPDAVGLSVLARLAPVRYYDVLHRLEPLIRRS
ncbi:MAG: SDR family NAD(P)-dependent oxidoreductase [Solirubrobacteraceae bacterium]